MLLRLGLLLTCLSCAFGARILAFLPFPAKSHHIAFQPILRELAVRGHHVDYVTAVPMSNPPKTLKEIRIKDLLSELHGQLNMKHMMGMSIPESIAMVGGLGVFIGQKYFEDEPAIKALLQSNDTYDVVMTEAHFAQEYATALAHKFKALGVGILPLFDSAWVNELSGVPDNPSYMIDFKAETTDKMTFVERLRNVYIMVTSVVLGYYFAMFPMQELADKYIRYDGWETRPGVVEMTSDLALILINSHHSFGFPYPKAPHVKEVGGMNLAPTKPLPKDLKAFIDSAEHGVIYFSYGSNVDMHEMTLDGKFDAFLNTFKSLKQKVLWKWKGSEIPKIDAPNVKIQEWFPQQDILAHKNVKLFITHGGLMSTIEAIYNAVPLIGTAVFGDQPKNLRFVEHVGIGVELKFSNITETSVSWAVNEVLNNPKYKQNMLKRSALFNDRQMKPVDEGVYWIEYIIRHGKVLQPASVHMPFYQVYLLDVLGVILVGIYVFIAITKRILRAICSLCRSKKPVSVNNSKKRQ